MNKLAAILCLCAVMSAGQALAETQADARLPVKNAYFSSTIPAGPGWQLIGSTASSMTYQWQDAERQRSWNIQLSGVSIKPARTRDDLVAELLAMSKGLLALPGAEVGTVQVLPARAGKYECVEGLTTPAAVTDKPMTLRFRLAVCRHPQHPNAAVLVAMSVGGRTGDDAKLEGFERVVDDLVMN